MASSSSASTPASSFEEYYSITPDENFIKNKCLIFDIREFDEGLHVDNRDEHKADIDLANFVKTFEELDFEVEVYTNMTRSEIGLKVIRIKMILTGTKCISIVVLSKGHQDYFLAKDGLFKIDWIWTPYMAIDDNSLFLNQPKLFIFQIDQISFNDLQSDAPSDSNLGDYKKPIPAAESDMFLIHHRIPANFGFPNNDWSFSKAMREVFTAKEAKKNHIGKLMAAVNFKMASVYREAEKKRLIENELIALSNGGRKADETAQKAATEIITKQQDAVEAELKAKEAKAKIAELDEIKKKTKEQKTERQIAQGQLNRNENDAKTLKEAVVNAEKTLVTSVEEIINKSKQAVEVAQTYVEEATKEVEIRELAIPKAAEALKIAQLNKVDERILKAAKAEESIAIRVFEEAKIDRLRALEKVEEYKKEAKEKAGITTDQYLTRAKQDEDKRKKLEQMETATTSRTTPDGEGVEQMEGVEKATAPFVEAIKEKTEIQASHNLPSKPMVATTVSHLRKLFLLKT